MKILFALAALLLFSFTHLFAQPGTLDQSFANGGKLIITNSQIKYYNGFFQGYVQYDNKILVATNSVGGGFLLLRLLPDGRVDSAFGNNGATTIKVTKYWIDNPASITVQNDKKIIVAGGASDSLIIVRINMNGTKDSTFGNNGITKTKIGDNGTIATCILIDNNKIVLGGYTTYQAANKSTFIARYNIDGSIDSSFANNGYAMHMIPGNYFGDKAFSILKHPNGSYILTGSTNNTPYITPFEYDFALKSYTDKGLLDSNFNSDGIVTTAFGIPQLNTQDYYDDEAFSGNIQMTNKILTVGTTSHGFDPSTGYSKVVACRYTISGQIDSSFGLNGVATTDILGNYSYGNCLLVQPDNKFVIGGYFDNLKTGNYDLALVKYMPNGNVDSSFGTNGITTTDFINQKDLARNLFFQYGINKILFLATSDTSIVLSRYNNEAILPISLSNFNLIKNQSDVDLNWQTNSENNISYFSVERSDNNIDNFKSIGVVKSSSINQSKYYFEDKQPFTGNNYYRLKEIDKDGKFYYSIIKKIVFEKKSTIRLFPNPVKDVLIIDGFKNLSNTYLTIINQQGLELAKATTNASSYKWDVKFIPSGIYFVKIENDGLLTTVMFIKQ